MINVKELNEEIFGIGIQNISWIAEAETPNGEWSCYADPIEQGDVFGFSSEKGFSPDTNLYWESVEIRDSIAFEGMKDIILIGYGPAYKA